MQNTPHRLQITVVLTAFRRTSFLSEAIESVLAQKRPADEVIVTDDSDSLEIRAICANFGEKVRYRSNPSPLGAALNIRVAVNSAQGDLLAILNDDDLWEPNFLASLVPPLEEKPERVLAFSDHWIMNAAGKIDEAATDRASSFYGRDVLPPGEIVDPVISVLKQNTVPLAMATVFRKDAVNWSLVTSEVKGAYDFWISCLLAGKGKPFYYVNRRLTRYRLHDGMETARQAADKNEDMAFIYSELLQQNYFPSYTAFLRCKLAYSLRTCGRHRMQFGDAASAQKLFGKSFLTRPTFKAAAGWLLAMLRR